MPNISAIEAIKNPRTQLRVSGGGVSFNAVLTDPFRIAGSAKYATPLETTTQETFHTALEAIKAVTGQQGLNLSLPSPKTAEQTVATWSSVDKLAFTLNVLFIALEEQDDIRRQIAPIYSAVYPEFDQVVAGNFMVPPFGYKPRGLVAENTLAVEIGNWWRSTGMLITNVDFEISKEVIASGSPLYALGTISFEHYRIISYQEFLGFIYARPNLVLTSAQNPEPL